MRLNIHNGSSSASLLPADMIVEKGSSCAQLGLQKYVFSCLFQSSKDVNINTLICLCTLKETGLSHILVL